jgi:hypothetical protein
MDILIYGHTVQEYKAICKKLLESGELLTSAATSPPKHIQLSEQLRGRTGGVLYSSGQIPRDVVGMAINRNIEMKQVKL